MDSTSIMLDYPSGDQQLHRGIFLLLLTNINSTLSLDENCNEIADRWEKQVYF